MRQKLQIPIKPLLALLLLAGCATSKTDVTAYGLPMMLYVSSQSSFVDPVNITVILDSDTIVASRDFSVGDGHKYSKFKIDLVNGRHHITASTSNGDAGLNVIFWVEKPTWLALNYWGKDHFELMISPVPFAII